MEEGMAQLRWLALGILVWGGLAHAQVSGAPQDQSQVKIDKTKLSYAIGFQIGSQFANGEPDVDIPTLQRAIQDAYTKKRPAVPMRDMHDQLRALDEQMHSQALAQFKRAAETNARKSAAYMESNRSKPGVIQLPSGIQYEVVKKGTGTKPVPEGSVVTVNFRAMLIDGTEFDSSWAHGSPVSFVVNNKVIPGWQEVIQRMHVGDLWKVTVPPAMAYGIKGDPPRIGPNEALVFEIELLEIKP
ncbi:FKBP-type peptidyl-prolyl cis-trans isomerase [Dyella kyungheensis]|uniref:Peptidyl-prolyl cis-trans isomerase n=2 Tax=Dyella kyungheensis TaxID=1242174 RepID=A0ABS2JL09_9GAMM|nr:FKBP-type peptidyl-prolyl cis-trans isomerase [Dyella kyungheensis]